MGYEITIKAKNTEEAQKMHSFLEANVQEWKGIFAVGEGFMTGSSVILNDDNSVGFHYSSWIATSERRYIYMIMALLSDLGFGDGIWLYDGGYDPDHQAEKYRIYNKQWKDHLQRFEEQDPDEVIRVIEEEVRHLKEKWEAAS